MHDIDEIVGPSGVEIHFPPNSTLLVTGGVIRFQHLNKIETYRVERIETRGATGVAILQQVGARTSSSHDAIGYFLRKNQGQLGLKPEEASEEDEIVELDDERWDWDDGD